MVARIVVPALAVMAALVGFAPATPSTEAAVVTPATPATGPCQATSSVEVDVFNFGFDPAEIEIPAGTSISWTNAGPAPHTATEDYLLWDTLPVASILLKILDPPIFDSGQLNVGDAFEFVFCDPDTYTYHCDFHPSMVATITVV